MADYKIDLVIPWVDGNDPAWQAERSRYLTDCEIKKSSFFYRDWGFLRYVFRGIEANLPWVNKVFFITCGHVPAWLNLDHPKLRLVTHKEYIPPEYLPTFSSIPIENNVHRIPDLSEHFIISNDDIFFIGKCAPDYFFHDGLPCDFLSVEPITERTTNAFGHILWNDMAAINRHFSPEKSFTEEKWLNACYTPRIKENNRSALLWENFSGFGGNHFPMPMLKTTLSEVWNEETLLLSMSSSHRFRSNEDANNWLMRYWQLVTGNFHPFLPPGRKYVSVSDPLPEIRDCVLSENNRIICFNDSADSIDFEQRSEYINSLLDLRLPDMCSFEKF